MSRTVTITTWQTSLCKKESDGICFHKHKDGKCLRSQVRNVYCKHVVTDRRKEK